MWKVRVDYGARCFEMMKMGIQRQFVLVLWVWPRCRRKCRRARQWCRHWTALTCNTEKIIKERVQANVVAWFRFVFTEAHVLLMPFNLHDSDDSLWKDEFVPPWFQLPPINSLFTERKGCRNSVGQDCRSQIYSLLMFPCWLRVSVTVVKWFVFWLSSNMRVSESIAFTHGAGHGVAGALSETPYFRVSLAHARCVCTASESVQFR